MKQYTLFFTETAKANLGEIFDFVANDSLEEAELQIIKIQEFCNTALLYTPEIGVKRDDLAEGLRSFVHAPYIIFYMIQGSKIFIRNVYHTSRNYSEFF